MDYKVFTKPVHVTTWMGLFLALVAGLAAFLVPQLKHAFMANAAFNGVIVFVLAVGIAVNLRQVWRLQREVLWIESFQQRPEMGSATGPARAHGTPAGQPQARSGPSVARLDAHPARQRADSP